MKSFKPATLTLGFLLCLQHWGYSQSAVDRIENTERNTLDSIQKSDQGSKFVPTIYDGELEDIGPQYLLLEKARRKWLEFFADLQVYRTSNANLIENNPAHTDILAATVEVAAIPYEAKKWGGSLKTRLGYKHQQFFYGTLSGDTDLLNGIQADNLDFNNRQPFTDLSFKKGPWTYRAGVYYSELRNRKSSNLFYSELVPSWSVAYDIFLNPQAMITLNYRGTYRLTDSESFGLLPDGWNDQTEHTLSATYSRLIREKFLFQAGAGFKYAYFTESNRDREDILGFTNVTLAYFINERASVRLFSSYEARESSESTSADYRNLNIGAGAAFSFKY